MRDHLQRAAIIRWTGGLFCLSADWQLQLEPAVPHLLVWLLQDQADGPALGQYLFCVSWQSSTALAVAGAGLLGFRVITSPAKLKKKWRKCRYDVTLKNVRANIVDVEKQQVVHILNVCL